MLAGGFLLLVWITLRFLIWNRLQLFMIFRFATACQKSYRRRPATSIWDDGFYCMIALQYKALIASNVFLMNFTMSQKNYRFSHRHVRTIALTERGGRPVADGQPRLGLRSFFLISRFARQTKQPLTDEDGMGIHGSAFLCFAAHYQPPDRLIPKSHAFLR